ncbi:prevent-host-death protein [Candidatus Amesbacteria bacterium RIFCSPHIGHO2_01_FULL_48_32]|uniref:Prevent-host-death protein n=1 Tax=Candidatus Amesbacteria bacterium RIFCSPLOWO2_01_FULL_48_25 TaxID=1797259 RepID=A0A1F4ZDT5_9BACT|nr:MAG: prevent-host-death protein [Candidatus Amesbacteria bacterium RIFCSPHIGHO2_01_FULL_48_32]OGD04461.1 MAG: prevent-host-death protein [Candidatus Amesbacteria bacterium RIFCSPLOWO2_01_FULL_48_25]
MVMNLTISKSQFKPKALEYFRMVEEKQIQLVVTDFGKPVVDIVPHKAKKTDPLAVFRGKLIKYEDPFEPVGLEDWEALK